MHEGTYALYFWQFLIADFSMLLHNFVSIPLFISWYILLDVQTTNLETWMHNQAEKLFFMVYIAKLSYLCLQHQRVITECSNITYHASEI